MTERCICGAAVQNMLGERTADLPPEERVSVWTHVPGSDTRCTGVRPISQFLPDRVLIQGAAEQMAKLSDRTRRAAGELESLQSVVAELTEEIQYLRAELARTGAVRTLTLVEVWERLVNEGHLGAALDVRNLMMEAKGKS